MSASNQIHLSESAARQLKSLRTEMGVPENQLIRFGVEPGGCSGFEYQMGFDEKQPGDLLIRSRDVSMLVDEDSMPYLNGCEVDFEDGVEGQGFAIRNPNARGGCGCGKSFH